MSVLSKSYSLFHTHNVSERVNAKTFSINNMSAFLVGNLGNEFALNLSTDCVLCVLLINMLAAYHETLFFLWFLWQSEKQHILYTDSYGSFILLDLRILWNNSTQTFDSAYFFIG